LRNRKHAAGEGALEYSKEEKGEAEGSEEKAFYNFSKHLSLNIRRTLKANSIFMKKYENMKTSYNQAAIIQVGKHHTGKQTPSR
jgi:hypothetical protein